jgi:hypothetical protein
MKNAWPYAADFQELVTEVVWRRVWNRPGLARRERILITPGMIAALNRPEVELQIHGALRNGCTPHLFFENVRVLADHLFGEEGKGFQYILSGMNAERKFRETRLYQVAPISTNLILSYLAEHVLGMPRSY